MAENGSLLKKALSTGNELNKEEVLDILFYVKQVFGFIIGILVGLAGVMGLPGIIAFVAASSGLSYIYVFKFLGTDEDVIENKDVLKEHFMNGFFPFLLSWIVTYNIINFS